MTDSRRYPLIFPEAWASSWGEDECGLWMGVLYKGVRHVFRWIEPGSFLMGSPVEEPERRADDQGESDETPHEVSISEGLWLGETTVTQALWEAVMGDNPSRFRGPERPVEQVSWNDAQRFLQRLNAERDDLGLRLPTEAEWEYACRAGTTTPFWFGNDITPEQVNYDGNYPYAGGDKGRYREETVDVKELPRNAWGLYQMHGNVLEWCQDLYGEYPKSAVTDPQGPSEGVYRVLRGGSWFRSARSCRSAYRGGFGPGGRDDFIGFRLARGRQVG